MWLTFISLAIILAATVYFVVCHDQFHFNNFYLSQVQQRQNLSTKLHTREGQVDIPRPTRPKRVVVAMTGATGAVLGIHLLQTLRSLQVETHLVISRWAAETIKFETDFSVKAVKALASHVYSSTDAFAPISSGSFQVDAMIVVPCSMRTLSAVQTGFGDDLICRAADVMLKEQRKLVLAVRETPLSVIHLDNMLELAKQRVVIFPPVPAFYTKPGSVEDIIEQSVGRMVDALDIGESAQFPRWHGHGASGFCET